MIVRYYNKIKRIMAHGRLRSLWVRRSKRRVAVGFTADRRRRVFSPVAALGLRRILRSRFWFNKLHGITNQNELSALCTAIIPCFAAKAPLHNGDGGYFQSRAGGWPVAAGSLKDLRVVHSSSNILSSLDNRLPKEVPFTSWLKDLASLVAVSPGVSGFRYYLSASFEFQISEKQITAKHAIRCQH
jgi:hypothetical protein